MLWVIRQTRGGRMDGGGFAMAADWLVRHFGDDPDAIRVGLELDNWPNFERDNLVLCFYASAKSRESKGLARLALAQYLEHKATLAEGAKKVEGRPTLYSRRSRPRRRKSLHREGGHARRRLCLPAAS